MKRYLDIIDFLRGFSIFTIVLMHLIQSYPLSDVLYKITSFGGAGVHVFILCSGFGLYLSYLIKPVKYLDFLKRRFIRVYVPYIIVILISAIIPFYNTSDDKWFQLLSHVFLFKMFNEGLESSYGGQMWFVSTIIQFYLLWPIVLYIFRQKYNLLVALIISLVWASFVAFIGYSDQRIWNSFFLQYLWEFVLGMYLAEYYYKNPDKFVTPPWRILIPVCFISMLLTLGMALLGGPWKLYNDIPSMAGYLFLCLIIYKLSVSIINRFFISLNKISYEWYLVHILVFACCRYFLQDYMYWSVLIVIQLLASYVVAYCYENLLRRIRLK